MKITRKSCLAAGACWSYEHLAAYIPPEGLTPTDVAGNKDVRLTDRVWALIYAAGLSAKEQRLFACRTARRALGRVANPDPRSVTAIDVAERFARGEATLEDLRVAADAAYDAYAALASAALTAYAAYAARVAAYAVDAAARAARADDAADAAYARAACAVACAARIAADADDADAASRVAAYAADAADAAAYADAAANAADAARDKEMREQIADLLKVLQ